MEQSQQPAAPKKKSRKKLYAIIAVVIVIVIIVAVVAIPRTTDIVPGGTVESVPAGEFYSIEFNTTGSGSLAVSVTATNGITFYLLTPSEYSSDVSSGSWNTYSFTSGHISSGSFNTNIGSGTWYAVYYNSNIVTTSTITINSMTFTT
ncbi:hypothetical protein ACNF40_05910 [Cuniculiplasma sp. SKW4]|uniref:hypothetical protein n=1 Tax=Cuniculiplasma sp. SKW4 TaxID=3400171 RepID=UPI003FD58CA2